MEKTIKAHLHEYLGKQWSRSNTEDNKAKWLKKNLPVITDSLKTLITPLVESDSVITITYDKITESLAISLQWAQGCNINYWRQDVQGDYNRIMTALLEQKGIIAY